MKVFTVHEPPNPPADRIDRAERLRFVRDGFSTGAALFTPLWLAARGLYVLLAAHLVVLGGLVALMRLLAVPPEVAAATVVGLQILIGLEASSVERWWLGRRGWSTAGSVVGRSHAECERRFYEGWLPSQPMIAGQRPSAAASAFATASETLAGGAGTTRAGRWWRRGRRT